VRAIDSRPRGGRATLIVLLVLAACTSSQSERRAPVRKADVPAQRLPSVAARPLAEEKLEPVQPPAAGDAQLADAPSDGSALPGEEQPSPAPVAPPDPQTMLASIGPATPPQRVASLRLTDEGRLLLDQGNAAAALDRIEKAVKIDPSNPHGYYWLAQVHYHNGRADQALAFADKAASLFTPAERSWLAQTYTFRGSILERAGRFKEARASYRRAVRIEPGDVAARAGLARLGEPSGVP
jgi:hypothetical protein